jgi:ribonuclease Z
MPKLIVLGSSNAVPTQTSENTHMVVIGGEHTVLVDCGNNPLVRLEQAGVDHHDLTDLVLTHFHPDHVAGVPLLLMDMWLLGRNKPLNIYGLHHTIDRVEGMMGFYGWAEWPDFFPTSFVRLPASELTPVFECDEMSVLASPVHHFIPNIGLRFEFRLIHKALAYSCDTEPCDEIVRLAAGADVLLHEASGPFRGHSSARQAAEIANKAEVGALYLIHYPTGQYAREDLAAEARKVFSGEVHLATDLMEIDFA